MNFKLFGNQFEVTLIAQYFLIFLILGATFSGCFASDTKRELYFSNAITDSVDADEVVWLEVNRERFLSLYKESESVKTKGAIILLHDLDQHPNHHSLIYSLRTELPRHQWSTLSLQMPLRELGAKISDYESLLPESLQRIDTAITFLEKKKIKPIAIVGLGLGGVMASHFVAQMKSNRVQAIVAAFLVNTEKNSFPAVDQYIKEIDMPFLDIVCCEKKLSRSSNGRKIAAKKNDRYQQLFMSQGKIENQDLFSKRLYSWFNRVLTSN